MRVRVLLIVLVAAGCSSLPDARPVWPDAAHEMCAHHVARTKGEAFVERTWPLVDETTLRRHLTALWRDEGYVVTSRGGRLVGERDEPAQYRFVAAEFYAEDGGARFRGGHCSTSKRPGAVFSFAFDDWGLKERWLERYYPQLWEAKRAEEMKVTRREVKACLVEQQQATRVPCTRGPPAEAEQCPPARFGG